MMKPNELRLLANRWRNIVTEARELSQVMMDSDVAGALSAGACEAQALSIAVALEERADHLESVMGTWRSPSCADS